MYLLDCECKIAWHNHPDGCKEPSAFLVRIKQFNCEGLSTGHEYVRAFCKQCSLTNNVLGPVFRG